MMIRHVLLACLLMFTAAPALGNSVTVSIDGLPQTNETLQRVSDQLAQQIVSLSTTNPAFIDQPLQYVPGAGIGSLHVRLTALSNNQLSIRIRGMEVGRVSFSDLQRNTSGTASRIIEHLAGNNLDSEIFEAESGEDEDDSTFSLIEFRTQIQRFEAPVYRSPRQRIEVPAVGISIDSHEVTIGDFAHFLGKYAGEPSEFITMIDGIDLQVLHHLLNDEAYFNYPMTHVDFFAAQRFCLANDGRLPRLTEWERIASLGSNQLYPLSGALSAETLNSYWPPPRNIGPSWVPEGEQRGPVQVGQYPALSNALEIYDLGGNISEWVILDNTAGNVYDDAIGAQGTKGGSWYWSIDMVFEIRQTLFMPPNAMDFATGFRCVYDPVTE